MSTESQGRNRQLLGRWGEITVMNDLRDRGWNIVATGYHCRFGEIDIIARNRRFLAFVEVKLRKDAVHGTAAEAVTPAKQQRLRLTAELYLAEHPTRLQPRFDVAEVYAPQGSHTIAPEIHYIENAF